MGYIFYMLSSYPCRDQVFHSSITLEGGVEDSIARLAKSAVPEEVIPGLR